MLEGRERVVQVNNTWVCLLGPSFAPALFAAHCLESRGDDQEADAYAVASLDRWPMGSSIVRSAHLALRARVAVRSGDLGTAAGFSRAAARVAVEEHIPLMAVLAGRERGGEEGNEIVREACEQIGRPLEVVLQELDQAQGESLSRP